MSDINHQLMALLDQYAQESGFKDLADLKHNYTDTAYSHVLPLLITRARNALEPAQ
jgi:hypothetical protein